MTERLAITKSLVAALCTRSVRQLVNVAGICVSLASKWATSCWRCVTIAGVVERIYNRLRNLRSLGNMECTCHTLRPVGPCIHVLLRARVQSRTSSARSGVLCMLGKLRMPRQLIQWDNAERVMKVRAERALNLAMVGFTETIFYIEGRTQHARFVQCVFS
jgi:hypothetical protein